MAGCDEGWLTDQACLHKSISYHVIFVVVGLQVWMRGEGGFAMQYTSGSLLSDYQIIFSLHLFHV